MHGEHPHSQNVGLTQVVDESADVAVKPAINTVNIPHLQRWQPHKGQSQHVNEGKITLKVLLENLISVCYFTVQCQVSRPNFIFFTMRFQKLDFLLKYNLCSSSM